jgi:hypothetical protein
VTLTAGGIGAYVRSKQDTQNTTLNPITFAHYELVAKEPVSQTSSVFTLRPIRPGGNYDTYDLAWLTGVWSVTFKQPQLQIGRNYTPLPATRIRCTDPKNDTLNGEDETLRFFIRKDPHGEVSGYLYSLNLGSNVEIRGPQVECEIAPEVGEILFIAGGTGIAPALQAAYTLLSRTSETHRPSIRILWANRRRDDCVGGSNHSSEPNNGVKPPWWKLGFAQSPLTARSKTLDPLLDPPTVGPIVKELEALKSQFADQITVDYFVDEENTFITRDTIRKSADALSSNANSQFKMILISGPPGFVNYMAGPKVWGQGQELQGDVQGLIKEVNLDGWTVWKL